MDVYCHVCRFTWATVRGWGSSPSCCGPPQSSSSRHLLPLPRCLLLLHSHLGSFLLSWLWRERYVLLCLLTPSTGRSLVRAARLVVFFFFFCVCVCVYLCLCTLWWMGSVVTKKHLYNQMCDVLFQSQVASQASVAQQQVRDFSFFHNKLTG